MRNDSKCIQVRGKNGRIHYFRARWIDLSANRIEVYIHNKWCEVVVVGKDKSNHEYIFAIKEST